MGPVVVGVHFPAASEGHFLWRFAPLEAQGGRVGFQPLNILKPFGPRLNIASVVLQGRRAQLGVELSYLAGVVFHGLFEGAPSRVDDLEYARNLVKFRVSRRRRNFLPLLAGHTSSGRLLWLGDFSQ